MWWVLTQLNNQRDRTNLRTRASTNVADHLFMAWAYWPPSRSPIIRIVRGIAKHCGYRYVWDTPNITEQNESGDTIDHSFLLVYLSPVATIWLYLFAPGGPYGLQIQGPLIVVPAPDRLLVGAKVERAAAQTFAHGVSAPISWDTVLLDTDDMVDLAADPLTITITVPGWYHIEAQTLWIPNVVGQRMLVLVSPAFHDMAKDLRDAPGSGIFASIHISAIAYQDLDDSVQLHCWQNSGGNLNINPQWELAPSLAVFKLPD